jgi:FHA domain
MTAKRDLKRRVRQRQARTGEAYVTARRHVVAATAASADDDADADHETGSETVATAGATASDPAADPADAATASPASGAPGVAADTTDPAASSAAAATRAVAAGTDPADTAPAPATAMPPATAVARGDTAVPTPAAPAPGNAASTAVSVVELLDVSEQARRLGLVCRIAMFPALAARVEPASVLARLRDLLLETAGDPQFRLLSQVALTGSAPPQPLRPSSVPSFEAVQRFFRRALAGIGGVSEDGKTLAFHVAGRDGLVAVGCTLHGPAASLVLSGIDDLIFDVAKLRDWLTAEVLGDAGRQLLEPLSLRVTPGAVRLTPKPFAPTLFVVHDGRRHAITRDEFLIGRSRETVHLAIKDGLVSRHHAAVIRRHGVHYLKDLGSVHGIMYKGMRIDNKRIDEGDVFQIGDHELRFTYRSDDEK